MNLFIKKLSFSLLAFTFVFFSCTTEQSLEITSPDPALVLQEPGINSVYLNFSLPENSAFTISWNDDLTGSSSYDVEMSLNAEFSSPVTIGTVNTNSFSINVEDLNAAIRNAGATTFKDIAVYIRVKGGGVNSNTVLFLVTTYPIANPQITSPDSTFEIVLSDVTENETAITVEWDDSFSPEDSSTSVTYFVEAAVAGTDFATIRQMGSTQDLMFSLTHTELNDIAASLDIDPDTAGDIDIRVRSVIEMAVGNLQRISDPITITVTPYETALPPVLYVVGGGVDGTGWGWTNPVEFPLQGAVYSANINLTTATDGAFRFFLQQDWNPDSYNYPWFADRGYTIDANLVNANDNDSNFKFIGTDGFYNLRIDTNNKTITLGEPVIGPSVSVWGVVGSAYNNWGAFDDAKFYSTDTPNVYVTYVSLVVGQIKFRPNNSWTDPLGEYGSTDGTQLQGTLQAGGSNIDITKESTYKITLNLNDNTYNIEEYFWGVVGSGYNNWGEDGPDAKFTYDYVSNTFKVGVKLLNGLIKFRLNEQWATNYGGPGLQGDLVADGANIDVTAGYYEITLDFENGVYAIVPADIFGVVGSSWNAWGDTTSADWKPDFLFTPLSNDVWVAEVVPLIEGQIKFRVNEDWGVNYGIGGSEGKLETPGGDINVITAGNYRIKLDFANLTYELNQVN